MKRILIILPNLDLGGTETVVMNYLRHMKGIAFDFVVHGLEGFYEEEARALGSRIFRVPTRGESFFKNVNSMRSLYKAHPEYDTIIVCTEHAFAFIEMAVAWSCGIKTRAGWSHFSDYQGASRLKRWAHFLARPLMRLFTNKYLACTEAAGQWLFGKKCIIIQNAIELDKYHYNEETRTKIRDNLGLVPENFVIGMVARLTAVKNHDFALDIVSNLKNAMLVLVGDGELKDQLKAKSKQLNISDRVIFTGAVDNPSDYYQAFDLLLIPSFHEGLTLVAIEAQAAGLPVFLSDTITTDLKITNNAHFLSLEKGAEEWAKAAVSLKKTDRKSPEGLENSGFHIATEAERFQKLF